MRVLVCGGRDFRDKELLNQVLNDLAKVEVIDCIIEGDAEGADRLAGFWAKKHHVDLLLYPADWNRHKKSAGPIRNQKMLDEGKPDLVIAFPGGKGTAHMVKIAKEAGVEVKEI